MDDLKRVLAQAFKARGKARLTRAELTFALSLDLKWFGTDEGKAVVEAGLRAGLLTEEDGKVTPAFDYRTVEVPQGFRPGPEILKKPLLERVEILLVNSGIEASAVRGVIDHKQRELCDLVTPEVAALVLAKERELDISGYVDEALRQVMKAPGNTPAF